jgi:hypothetical protein
MDETDGDIRLEPIPRLQAIFIKALVQAAGKRDGTNDGAVCEWHLKHWGERRWPRWFAGLATAADDLIAHYRGD